RASPLAPGEGGPRGLRRHARHAALPDQRPEGALLPIPAAHLPATARTAWLRRSPAGSRLGRGAGPGRPVPAEGDAPGRHAGGVTALVAILLTYLALASGYALGTPRWNNPDEPAHYNYVAQVARTVQLPVLEAGGG